MVKKTQQKSAKYSADMYHYDDGVEPRDLLQKKKKSWKDRLFHNAWTDKA